MFILCLQPNVDIPAKWEFLVNDVEWDGEEDTHMWEIYDVVLVDSNPLDDHISIHVMLNGKMTLLDGLDAHTSDIVRIVA